MSQGGESCAIHEAPNTPNALNDPGGVGATGSRLQLRPDIAAGGISQGLLGSFQRGLARYRPGGGP